MKRFVKEVIVLSLALLVLAESAVAQRRDTTTFKMEKWQTIPRYPAHYTFKKDFTWLGFPLIAAGFIVKGQKKDFRDIRNEMEPLYKNEVDNYTQFIPMAATWGMNVFGYKGRSKFGRMIVSQAISSGVMAGIVNAMKYSIKEMRPDGSTQNSFPSGHTATAFMAATFLHKEYGLTRSPWFSVAGYSLATTTGVMRVLNNRHWISDVLVGAGIGVLSADLGYAIGNWIYGDKGLYMGERADMKCDLIHNPSFLSVNMGVSATTSTSIDIPEAAGQFGEDLRMRFGTGTSLAVEGAYFFNSYIGVGGRLKVTTTPIRIYSAEWEYDEEGNLTGNTGQLIRTDYIQSNNVGVFSADLGLFLSYPFTRRFAVGYKLLAGNTFASNQDFNIVWEPDPADPDDPGECPFIHFESNGYFRFTSGLSVTYALSDNLAVRLYVDTERHNAKYDMQYLDFVETIAKNEAVWLEPEDGKVENKYWMYTAGMGLSLSF